MLEVKNLVKIYKTKGGVETKALDNVSVNFPETGLVFLLGKSGSGKSTLLNMIGGLDRPDSGEVVVKGRSSKDFSAADFDSYRNTYIGFIFQEYNVLNEFNIEQNISLALQLQGKKNDKEAVNALLKEVDLEGFNKRKPNTLSGGQKQRIAIARALIKQPEIIMADEPTGALDSNTGKQVLETLKKLSKTKLVIIVSHDQDFAEEYGDRIIELKDGKILTDKSKEYVAPQAINEKMQIINGNIIDIKKGSALTDADFKQLYQLIKKQDKEVLISTGEDNIKATKKAARISSDGKGERFSDTKEVPVKKYDGKQTKFIRSHMPFSRSFKMGASGLKTKPVRLIFTILLSVASFTMFGVASTLMLYDESYSLSAAMENLDRTSEAVGKQYKYTEQYIRTNTKTGEVTNQGDPYEGVRMTYFGNNEIKELNNSHANKFIGVFTFNDMIYARQLPTDTEAFPFSKVSITGDSEDFYSYNYFNGLSDAEASFFTANNFQLTGAHPVADDEIAISNYHYELFKESGEYGALNNVNDIIGKKIAIRANQKDYSTTELKMKVTGVYNFGSIPSKYEALKEPKAASVSDKERSALVKNFDTFMDASFHTVGYVGPTFYDKYGFIYEPNTTYIRSTSLIGYDYSYYPMEKEDWNVDPNNYRNIYTTEALKESNTVKYYDANMSEVSEPITLTDNDVLLPYQYFKSININFHYYGSPNNKFNNLSNNIRGRCYSTEIDTFVNDYSSEEPTLPLSITYKRLVENASSYIENGEYPDGFNIDTDLQTVETAFDDMYQRAARNYYYLKLDDVLRNKSLANYDTKVTALLDKMKNYTITTEELNTLGQNLKDYIDADASLNYAIKYAMAASLIDLIYSSFNDDVINPKVHELYGKDVYFSDIINNYRNDPTDADLAEKLTTIFEYAYKTIFEKSEVSYEFNPTFLPNKAYRNRWDIAAYYSMDSDGLYKELTVKGYFDIGRNGDSFAPAVNKNVIARYIDSGKGGDEEYIYSTIYTSDYVRPADEKYVFALAATNYNQGDISLFTSDHGTYKYTMSNSIYLEVSTWTNMINSLKTIFLIIGAVTGVLAALMLLNFISVSISSKKKDIGILRAVGARGSDVFKIFFSESSIITLICFVLSSIAGGITCFYLNDAIKDSLGITLLNYGIINIALILGVGIVISFIATFIPVLIASKKPPVEAIRSL